MKIELGDFVNFKFEEQVYVGKVRKTQTMYGFIFYDIDYQNTRAMGVREFNVTFLKRPKLKFGEWVKLNCFAYPKHHNLKGTIVNTTISSLGTIHYDVNFRKDGYLEKVNFVKEDLLEKFTDPKVDIKTTITTKDFLDACDYLIREEKYDYDKYILGVRSGKSIFQKDLMKTLDGFKYYILEEGLFPTKVIFNKDKEKVTLLFSKNGKIPYESYSSKTSGKDTYDREFGLYLSYYKYLNKGRDNKEFIDSIFKQKLKVERLAYLKGAVHDIVKKQVTEISAFENMVKEILKCEFEWDLHEHEAKLKLKKEREKRIKERSSQIAIKEKEIESLRKQNDKETLNYLKANTPKDKLPFE